MLNACFLTLVVDIRRITLLYLNGLDSPLPPGILFILAQL
jgi:hypothetical protein